MNELDKIKQEIMNDIDNLEYTNKGWVPVYTVSENSKIVIIGQAPGIRAQESKMAFNDPSGNRLREWLGVSKDEFYDTNNFALIPMDFYFPGDGKTGDLPPRKNFASKWHEKIFSNIKDIKLIILIGSYSQKHYLKNNSKKNLTETVRSYRDYLPKYFPLTHPSPRNIRWFKKNPWFDDEVIPALKELVKDILNK